MKALPSGVGLSSRAATIAPMRLPDGYFHGGDIHAYRWLAAQLPPRGSLVELGSYRGRSICSLASILREREVTTTLVDTFVGLPENPYVTEVVSGVQYDNGDALEAELRANLDRFQVSATVLREDSATAAARFADGSLDLVFIDADHQYDAVLRDLEAWWPKISPTGRIAGHDYSAEIEKRFAKPKYGASGGYHVARALRTFYAGAREVKKVPRQPRTSVWYVNRDPGDDLVLDVVSTTDLERSLRTHLRPEKAAGITKRQLILELIQAMPEPPTRQHAVYECSKERELGCYHASTWWFIAKLLQSGHLRLVPRSKVLAASRDA